MEWKGTSSLAVTFAQGKFVSVGAQVILDSVDGRTWNEETSPTPKHLNAIIYGAKGFVAVGMDGTIIHSSRRDLQVDAVRVISGNFSFSIFGGDGQSYRVEASPSLAPTSWVPVSEGFLNENSTFIDTNLQRNSMRFYRVVSDP